MEHVDDSIVLEESACDAVRARLVATQPQVKCPQSAQRQKRVLRRQTCTEQGSHGAEPGHMLPGSRNNPEHEIGMAAQILRPRVEDQVDAELPRLLTERRRPGIVGDRQIC